MSRYWGPIRALGGTAAIMIALALIFPVLRDAIIPAESRGAVLVQAVPFVAAFVAVLMLFILLIVVAARRLNGRISNRAHSPIAGVLIAGIVAGVVFLFQPFFMVGYRYGFSLLLVSTLGFILWSHVTSRSPRQDATLPPVSRRQQVVAGIAGLLVTGVLAAALITANVPVEPYGIRERQWERYDEARKAAIAAERNQTFALAEVPFLIVLSLFPGGLVFFAVRALIPDDEPAPSPLGGFAPVRRG